MYKRQLYFPITEENLQQTIKNEQLALVEIEQAILMNPDKVSCIIIEVIQAEGGDNHFSCLLYTSRCV